MCGGGCFIRSLLSTFSIALFSFFFFLNIRCAGIDFYVHVCVYSLPWVIVDVSLAFLSAFYRIFTTAGLFRYFLSSPLPLYFVTSFSRVYELWLWNTVFYSIIPLYCLLVSCGLRDFSMLTSIVTLAHIF